VSNVADSFLIRASVHLLFTFWP